MLDWIVNAGCRYNFGNQSDFEIKRYVNQISGIDGYLEPICHIFLIFLEILHGFCSAGLDNAVFV